jgi:sugar-phosphatase
MQKLCCAAVLFDLDGVLVDSTRAIVRHWTAWARNRDIDPAQVLAIVHGRRTIEVLQAFAPHLATPEEATRVEEAISNDTAGIVAITGAAALLSALPSQRWCVVTSGMGRLAFSRLRAAGLPLPRILVSADDVTKGKPDPEPYLKGAQLLGIVPKEGVVIEDAPNGIHAGNAAGMKVIAVATTYPASALEGANAIVPTLTKVQFTGSNDKLELTVIS